MESDRKAGRVTALIASKPNPPPPLGVVIPTRNSRPYLERHVAGMQPWLDLATEVVVVDSHSEDGTVAFLQDHLRHPTLRYIEHPPGLYASWNRGIGQITADLVYIATAGDTITRAGMLSLMQAASGSSADVVISVPAFADEGGAPVKGPNWPIHDVVEQLQPTGVRQLHPLEALIFAAVHLPDAFMGSCASCLFRTRTLQERPFPTEFGTSGDSIWAARYVAELSWVIVPETFTTFLLHPTTAGARDRKANLNPSRPDRILSEAVGRWRATGVLSAKDLDAVQWSTLADTLRRYFEAKVAYDRYRHATWPWFLLPAAWRVRSARHRAQAVLEHQKGLSLQAVKECR